MLEGDDGTLVHRLHQLPLGASDKRLLTFVRPVVVSLRGTMYNDEFSRRFNDF
jgi:hypothetical protein